MRSAPLWTTLSRGHFFTGSSSPPRRQLAPAISGRFEDVLITDRLLFAPTLNLPERGFHCTRMSETLEDRNGIFEVFGEKTLYGEVCHSEIRRLAVTPINQVAAKPA